MGLPLALLALSALAALPLAARAEGPSSAGLARGPMVGAVSASSARIWLQARTAGSCTIALAPLGQGSVRSVRVELDPAEQLCAVAVFEGLTADRHYAYSIVQGAEVLATGRLRTAPAPGSRGTLRIAASSCFDPSDPGPVVAWAALARERADLFLSAGDLPYADRELEDEARGFWRARTVRAKRPGPSADARFAEAVAAIQRVAPERMEARWLELRASDGFAEAAANLPMLHVWDDHETGLNDGASDNPVLGTARALFRRYTANPSYGDGERGTYFTSRWGSVELFCLDDQSFRTPRTPKVRASARTLLGPEQLAWLLARLEASDAVFKVLVTGSPWHDKSGKGDGWTSAPRERQRVVDHIFDRGISGVVLLSGDVHRSELHRLDDLASSGVRGYPLYEVVASAFHKRAKPLLKDSPSRLFGEGSAERRTRTLLVTLDFDTVTAGAETLTLRYIDGADGGRELFRFQVLASELAAPMGDDR